MAIINQTMNQIKRYIFLNFLLVLLFRVDAQQNSTNSIIHINDFKFLEELTKDVLESSRIYPGQAVPLGFGTNNTGGILIRPGGRDCYPAFWIRDYSCYHC